MNRTFMRVSNKTTKAIKNLPRIFIHLIRIPITICTAIQWVPMIRKWDAFHVHECTASTAPIARHSLLLFACPSVALMLLHKGCCVLFVLPFIEENRTKATNGRLQFGGNDHLILANHTCCECIKRNGIICIFHIFTTNDKHLSNDRVYGSAATDSRGDTTRMNRWWRWRQEVRFKAVVANIIRAPKKCIFNKDVVKVSEEEERRLRWRSLL